MLKASQIYLCKKGGGVVFYGQVFDFEFCDVTWKQGYI